MPVKPFFEKKLFFFALFRLQSLFTLEYHLCYRHFGKKIFIF